MAYFIPSYIQKRLLQYALNRLELLDSDALNLENLDIVLGKRSTVELRDVGLRLSKLTSLLHLPKRLRLIEARILRLQVTVPADIYSSGITLEVDGVLAQVELLEQDSENVSKQSRPDAGSRRDDESRQGGRRLRSPPIRERKKRSTSPFFDSDEEDDSIPTTQDLAKSFLNTEPQEEKEELEAAINTQSQRLSESSLSTAESTTEQDLGTGTELSLPGFLASFLKGIKDRLKVKIRDVELRVGLQIPRQGKMGGTSARSAPASISLRINKMSIDATGTGDVGQDLNYPSSDHVRRSSASPSKADKRRIHLEGVGAFLVTEEQLPARTANVTRSPSSPGSPSRTSSSHNNIQATLGFSSEKSSPTLSVKDKSSDSHSPTSERSSSTKLAGESLIASITTADGDRFADPVDDESRTSPASPTASKTQFEESSREQIDRSILDEPHLEESQVDELWKSYGDNDEPNLQHLAASPVFESDVNNQDIQPYQSSDSLPRIPGFMNTSDLISFEGASSENASDRSDDDLQTSEHLVQSSTTLDAGLLDAQLHPEPSPGSEPMENPAHDDSDQKKSGTATPLGEEMSESKIYSHEEAESLYMSAVGAASAESAKRFHLPGAWDSQSENGGDEASDSVSGAQETGLHLNTNAGNASEVDRSETPKPRESDTWSQPHSTPTSMKQDKIIYSHQDEALNTSRLLPSDTGQTKSAHNGNFVIKQFLRMKEVSLWIAESGGTPPASDLSARKIRSSDQSIHQAIPGTFSEYAERGTSPRRVSSERSSSLPSQDQDRKDEFEIFIGDVELMSDVVTIQLLLEAAQLLLSTIKPADSPGKVQTNKAHTQSSSAIRAKLNVQGFSIFFVENHQAISESAFHGGDIYLESLPKFDSSSVLFKCCLQRMRSFLKTGAQHTLIEIGVSRFSFGYSDEDILYFDDSARLRTSTRDLREPQVDAISVYFTTTPDNTAVKIGTLPINIDFDLQKLDDALISFGGVSGVLELSSSFMSNSTIIPDSPSPKQPRVVHFERPHPELESEVTPATKLNVRLGGALVTVKGKTSGITFQSSAVKVLYRPKQGLVGLSIDEIRLLGPHLLSVDADSPLPVQLTNTRIEFLFNPRDDDLERLLSLLMPSRDKYENDDDILIDTLLRQRRKGSVLRISIQRAQVEIEDLESIQTLSKLGDELAKLATVTKYLPEDDRPGILTLCAIEEFDIRVVVSGLVGTLMANAQRSQIAHVGLPSLLAIEVGKIQAQRGQQELLVHSILDLSPSEQLPMIMARFLGGEVEPTVKVKLFNLCLEYRVPTIMAVLGIREGGTAEDVVADLAASIATITDHAPKDLSPQSTKSSEHPESSPKVLHLDVILRDCAIGLNPRNMSSKILVVLTDTKLLSNLPGKENFKLGVDVRRASILMTDQEHIHIPSNELPSKRPGSAGPGSRQVTELCKRGYVSVSYISAAHADVHLLDNADGSKTAEVELKDDLFVLETCADSTQTLFATLNGLKPPMPPSRDVKYRTEVMPMEEMMASFTGDAFALGRSERDAPEEPLGHEEGDLLEDEEIPANLEYVGSFYNPDPPPTEEEYGDTMLEEDVQQIASPRPIREIGDRPLLESFQEQYEVGSSNGPLAFDENYFGTGSEVKGHARKWNSVKNQLGTTNEFKTQESPLRVRARDMHIIWNLFDGYDWQSTRDVITKTVKDVEHRAEERRSRRRRSANVDEEDEESVIGDFLFNSIYIGIPANRDPKDLSRQITRNIDDLATETESLATGTTTTVTAGKRSPSRGHSTFGRGKRLKIHRSKQHKITFELKGVSMDMIAFPPGSGETQSSVDVKVKEFEIFDHVPSSTWKKFATYLHDAGEREMGKPMIQLQMLTVKPVADLAASEVVLKVNVLPLRLHVDQDALDFITRFFEFKAPSDNKGPAPREDEVFLQRVEVNTVRVKLDYKPKKIDYAGLRSGHTSEFMNFFILDSAEFYLRHVIVYGILGFDKLHKTLNDIWMPDVRGNQLPSVLAGLTPVRGLVNVGSGVRDLVVVPMREYRKDGRVVRSIQKGAVAFAKTTTSELARLGARLAIGTQTALQGAENMLSPTQAAKTEAWEEAHLSSDDEDAPKGKKNISHYADAPINISSALRSAAQSLERDLLTARDAIIAIPGEVAEAEGLAEGAKAVVRRAPTVLLRPAMGVAGAVGKVGLGVGNWVDPEGRMREEREGKWKRH
ncbi:MAG: autophagy- protein 2 [Bathelium mastoideum]|nr:MAG: autophagy- protein 2 [Bathelium mastoideum]